MASDRFIINTLKTTAKTLLDLAEEMQPRSREPVDPIRDPDPILEPDPRGLPDPVEPDPPTDPVEPPISRDPTDPITPRDPVDPTPVDPSIPARPRDPNTQTRRSLIVEISPDGTAGQIARVLKNRSDVMLLLNPGKYLGGLRVGDYTHGPNDNYTFLGSNITIASKDPKNRAEIWPTQGDLFNFSDTRQVCKNIVLEDIKLVPGTRSGLFFNFCKQSVGHQDHVLRRVEIDGLASPNHSKWLITGYNLHNFVCEDFNFHDVRKSGDFQQVLYIHAHTGPVTLRRGILRNCGRSAIQSRNPEFDTQGKKLQPARGLFLIEDVLAENSGQMDGGCVLTFVVEENVELRRVVVKDGYEADQKATGAVVFWAVGGHSYAELGRTHGNGRAHIEDCIFDTIHNDRDGVSLSEIGDLTFINNHINNPNKVGVHLDKIKPYAGDGIKPNGKELFYGNSFGSTLVPVRRMGKAFTAAELANFMLASAPPIP